MRVSSIAVILLAAPGASALSSNYLDAFSPKSNAPAKSYGFSSYKTGQAAPGTFSPTPSAAAAPAAPVASGGAPQQQASSSGGYLDAFSPKSSGPAKSYGLSSFKPGQAVPQTMGFANSQVSGGGGGGAAPVAPAAQQGGASSGGYLDAFSPKSNAPAKSYGLSSYKPGQAVPQTMGFANSQVGGSSAGSSVAAPAAPAQSGGVSSGGYLDAVSPKSNAPAKSYGLSSYKPGQAVPQTMGFANSQVSSSGAAPVAPAAQQGGVSSGGYLDAFSPKSNAPAKSYGLSSYKPGQAVPQTMGFANSQVGGASASSTVAAPAAPAQSGGVSSGGYLDAFSSPSSGAPAKSYGLSSYKPGQAVPQTMGFANSQVGASAPATGGSAAMTSNPYAPSAAPAAGSGNYMDGISSARPSGASKSYAVSSWKPGR